MSVLKEKIAGMTDQQAEKLAREIQEFIEMFDDPEEYPQAFPLLRWLWKSIKLEGTIAEQIHLCYACTHNNHEGHRPHFIGEDNLNWSCKCKECVS